MSERVYYPIQQICIASHAGSYIPVLGGQSLSVSGDNPITQIFQLGQLEVYGNITDLPNINVNVEKVLDGYPLVFHLASKDATDPGLVGRTVKKCKLGLSVFSSDQEEASGTPMCTVEMSGFDIASISYQFNTSDVFRETVGFVGNDIIVSDDDEIVNPDAETRSDNLEITGAFGGTFTPFLNKKEHMDFEYTVMTTDDNGSIEDPDCTVLPQEIDGISDSGTNEKTGEIYDSVLQSITVSVDLGRSEIPGLGSKFPQCRYVEYPVEVTCEVECTPKFCGFVSAVAAGIYSDGEVCGDSYGKNSKDRTIRIATCEGTRIYTGTKNQLRSFNWSGGDTSGGNVTMSYSYVTYNHFTVLHENDPNSNGATWWTNRTDYLVG